MSQFRLWNFKS